MSTKIGLGSAAKDEGWNNDHGHPLLEMGDIKVKSRWEVTRERRGSSHLPNSRGSGRPSQFRATMVPGDNIV